MKSVQTSTLLKLTLWLDAAVCAALAVLQLLGGSALAQELALPRNLVLATGVFLLPWSAILLWLTRSPAVAREWVIWVIAGNALWALGALGLLLADGVASTAWGSAYLLLHTVGVLFIAALEWFGLRASTPMQPGDLVRA